MRGQLSLGAGTSWGSGSGMKRGPASPGLGHPSAPPGLSRAGWECLCCKSALYLEVVSFGRTSVPSHGILLCHQAGRSCPGLWGAIPLWGLGGHSPGPEPFPHPHFCSSPAPGAEEGWQSESGAQPSSAAVCGHLHLSLPGRGACREAVSWLARSLTPLCLAFQRLWLSGMLCLRTSWDS